MLQLNHRSGRNKMSNIGQPPRQGVSLPRARLYKSTADIRLLPYSHLLSKRSTSLLSLHCLFWAHVYICPISLALSSSHSHNYSSPRLRSGSWPKKLHARLSTFHGLGWVQKTSPLIVRVLDLRLQTFRICSLNRYASPIQPPCSRN